MQRCDWPLNDPLMIAYHDTEWGVPLHDDQKLYEFMLLDAFQAGLSWAIILKKRAAMKLAFDGFDPSKIADYDDAKIAHLLQNPGIIRNRLKIRASVANARAFLNVQQECGSFDRYIWRFVNDAPIVNQWQNQRDLPARSAEAEAMSRDLLARGFRFVGPTICYAFMQAAGLVNDHLIHCYRYQEICGGY